MGTFDEDRKRQAKGSLLGIFVAPGAIGLFNFALFIGFLPRYFHQTIIKNEMVLGPVCGIVSLCLLMISIKFMKIYENKEGSSEGRTPGMEGKNEYNNINTCVIEN